MLIYLKLILCDVLSLLLFICIYVTKTTSSSLITNDYNDIKRAEEYIMTSATIDGIKRSNVCDDGYRIEGALLKSYPYSKHEPYLPYEDCSMTFQARRSNNQIRIRILTLDLNDIHGGVDCLDSLRFYKSTHPKREEKLDIVECGQLNETDNFHVVSSTGIVTARFSTDGGNVSGLGFKVVLTSFRYPNKTHPCDPNDDEFLCTNGDCISSSLLCDGVAHCLDGSDETSCNSNSKEIPNQKNIETTNRPTKNLQWRGLSILAFLFLIFIVFLLFLAYFLFRRFVQPPIPLINGERKNYSTIVNSPLNGPKTEVIITNRKRLDDDYNLI